MNRSGFGRDIAARIGRELQIAADRITVSIEEPCTYVFAIEGADAELLARAAAALGRHLLPRVEREVRAA